MNYVNSVKNQNRSSIKGRSHGGMESLTLEHEYRQFDILLDQNHATF